MGIVKTWDFTDWSGEPLQSFECKWTDLAVVVKIDFKEARVETWWAHEWVTMGAKMETRHDLAVRLTSYPHLWISKLPERSVLNSWYGIILWRINQPLGNKLIVLGPEHTGGQFILIKIDIYFWYRFTILASRALACSTIQEFTEYLIHRHGIPMDHSVQSVTHFALEVWEWSHDNRTYWSFHIPPSPEEPT